MNYPERMFRTQEWWRERRIAPATFFGFPDVTKATSVAKSVLELLAAEAGLRGGSMYVEQMDAAPPTVSVPPFVWKINPSEVQAWVTCSRLIWLLFENVVRQDENGEDRDEGNWNEESR